MAAFGPERPPRSPTVAPAAAVAPKPAVTEPEVIVFATDEAQRGDLAAMVRVIETLPAEQREGVV